MEWQQILVIVAANLGTTVGLFLWCRHEAAEDRRQFTGILQGIQTEMKDFHGRLCSIEERQKR